MPSIGETLREARMRQRLDIADVEARTKIRAKYLRALENEEFGLLPGSTFVKTFLRTYAEVLGLDAHLLVEEYRASYEVEEELEQQALGAPAAGAGEREPRYRGGPPSPLALAGVALAAVLALLLVLGLTGGEDGDGEERAADTAAETTEEARTQPRRRRPRPPARNVTLEVTPNGPTYVCVDNGPGTDVAFEGTINEPQSFRGRTLRINLGRTQVEMKVNGRPFRVEPSANPVGYEITPTGSKELPPGQRPCV